MLSLLGILIAAVLIIYMAYEGMSVILLAPALATVAALFTLDSHPLALYTQVFMNATGGFIITYFPLFLLGALFGKLMDDCGAASAIAVGIVRKLGDKHASLAIVLACAILTYGGVSLFVVAFAVYPIASHLFQRADIPKRLVPASIALGSFTFTMSALPGSPAIQNTIPMPAFGTTAFAAPGLGIIAAIVMLAMGHAWIHWQISKARKSGEGYEKFLQRRATDLDPNAPIPENVPFRRRATDHNPHAAHPKPEDIAFRRRSTDFDPAEIKHHAHGAYTKKRIVKGMIPIAVVLCANYVLSRMVVPEWDATYLQDVLFGHTKLSSVMGLWSTFLALLIGIGALIVINRKYFVGLRAAMDSGAHAAVLPIFNTASMVGFGSVIAALPAFALLRDFVLGIDVSNPLISLGIAVNVLAGITGSASGGLSIALNTLGDNYAHMADQAGISRELLHRVTSIATSGLHVLPHNGAVITLFAISGLTHRQAYKDLFYAIVPGPLVALVVVIALGSVFGSF